MSNSDIHFAPSPQEQIITTWGFFSVTHLVITEDGYALKLIQAWDLNGQRAGKKMLPDPVVVGHGHMQDSNSMVFQGDMSIVQQLIKQGYYVWLVNFRGNSYSAAHMTIRDKTKFYDFSFDEMGMYDMPAVLKTVKRLTKTSGTPVFLGYGMSNAAAFIYAITKPQEAQKYLKGIVAWAPLIYVSNMKSLVWFALQFVPYFESLWKETFHGEVKVSYDMVQKFCTQYTFQLFICNFFRMFIGGDNIQQINPELLPLGLLSHAERSSYKTLVHYAQLVQTGKFQAMDLGSKKNNITYGQTTPMQYNISAINVPVAIYYGPNDWLTDSVDVQQIYSELNPKVRCGLYRINYDKFSHTDFQEAKVADPLLYKPTLDKIAQICTNKC
ncbi:unnamed protein product [Acanthoscelides obtectus]|uniref:Lipase n=1 Tax=Acanthoscelides obtectus TaxID=200917 RepID=A0A9P0JZG9_ACAOB|nr:unnamed protein product [Acanthoscelides obtectus]CAK1646194.1 Lipase 1 [Acanthoscelides obtectus]